MRTTRGSRLVRLAAAAVAALVLALGVAGCRAPSKEGSSTFVERTRVSRVTGTAADTTASEPETSLPGQGCKHVWRPAERETHAYIDATGEIAMAALCTPIRCEKCGAVRHECAPRRRR